MTAKQKQFLLFFFAPLILGSILVLIGTFTTPSYYQAPWFLTYPLNVCIGLCSLYICCWISWGLWVVFRNPWDKFCGFVYWVTTDQSEIDYHMGKKTPKFDQASK